MSSFRSSSPLAIPYKFRRKSSSASTNPLIDNNNYSLGDAALSSSPLLSSPPPLTPLHLARPYECTEWQANDYPDDLDEVIYSRRDNVDDVSHRWSCHSRPEHSIPYIHPPLPSLMTKFAAHTLWGDASLPYSTSPLSSVPQTTYFYPQGDSAIADDCEEYDLESMNIHIHETYFTTSAERGRWLSSPIASRVQSHTALPTRGHSSPVISLADMSPLGERLRRLTKSCTVDEQISTSFSEDHDEDMHCSSSLPPSSPLTSPLSSLSFLDNDCEDDAVFDPCPNSNNYRSFGEAPELSISSASCTPPVELLRPSTPQRVLTVVSALPEHFPCHSSPRHSHSPNPINAPVRAPSAAKFESDDILSPLSQFEVDLPEVEPLKLPLSDMENKFYPGQHTASPGVATHAARSHSGPPSVQFLSMNSNHGPLDVSLDIVGEANLEKSAKKRENVTDNPEARRTKKRAAIRSRNPSSSTKKRRGAENHTTSHSEPPSKKLKLSRCRDDSAGCGANSRPGHGGIPKVERLWRSPSRPAVERCDSESPCARDRETSEYTVQQQRRTPDPVDAVDVEFHASLTGMLVEALATSRATSMDSAALYLVLTQAHPYLTAERSKQELLMDIATVLETGRARCGMFEKVDSSGKRSRHKALESRWFYIPERDEDEERASLISAIMPRQKRNETKKYKQYYYRPLDKMSRWDPEDAP